MFGGIGSKRNEAITQSEGDPARGRAFTRRKKFWKSTGEVGGETYSIWKA